MNILYTCASINDFSKVREVRPKDRGSIASRDRYFPLLYNVQNSWVHSARCLFGVHVLSPVLETDIFHLVLKL